MKAILFSVLFYAFHGLARDFPSKPVRIAVPWPPGGNVEITARTVQPALAEALGQQVLVENRAGASGLIGSGAVAKSPADGYTLLLGSTGTVTIAPAVHKNVTYDPIRDFTAVGGIQATPAQGRARSQYRRGMRSA